MNSVGKKIKELRKLNNMKQEDLARFLMVSDKTISSYECSRTLPDVNTLFKLSTIFKISILSLLDNDFNDNNYELEVKLKVDEEIFNKVFNKVFNNIRVKDCIEVKQIDTYYEPCYMDFNGKTLRVRCENGINILSYKNKVDDSCREELEIYIDNYENLDRILSNLGFNQKGKVIKKRIKVMYDDKYEFSFDNVKDVGLFVEIEVKKIDESNSEELHRLYRVIEEVGLSLDLIDNKKYYEYL